MSSTVAKWGRRVLKKGLKIGSRPRAASKVGPDRTGRGTCHEGAVRRSERREAPIRCGFARTYVADSQGTHAVTARTPLRQRGDCPPSDYRGAIIHTSSSSNRSGDVV